MAIEMQSVINGFLEGSIRTTGREPVINELIVSENGTYIAPIDIDGYNPVIVNVPKTPLNKLTVTENGTYTAPAETGYDEVNVNVPLPSNAYLLKEIEDVDIASFSDGSNLPMPKLQVAIEPQQDLHGYDSPWVGGAGKNKLPLTVESIKTASDKSTWNNNSITINGITYEIQVDADGNVSGIKTNGTASGDSNLRIYDGEAEFHGKLLNGCPSNGSINTYYMQLSNVSVGSDYDLGNGTVINQTDTGRWILIINIKRGTTVSNLMFKPMIRLATETDATFAPYSNICPIIGWDEVNVTRTGKNLFDRDNLRRGVYTNADGTTQSGSATTNFSSQFIKVMPNTTYSITMFDGSYENGSLFGIYYDENKNGLNQFTNILRLVSNESKTFTTPSNAYYIVFTGHRGSGTDIFTTANTMVCEGTPTTYEPYNGNTYTIDLDGTRYGGTLDVVSGELKVVPYYVSYNGETLEGEWISDRDVYAVGSTPTIGAQVVNIGATPQVIQLTPTQIKTLLGNNVIMADTGSINNIEYFAK